MKHNLKKIRSIYSGDYRFFIVTNSVIKTLKYQTIAGWSCTIDFNEKNGTKKKNLLKDFLLQ